MPQKITTGYKALVEAAEREIETVSIEDALKLHGRDDTLLVDLRDPRELEREGKIPGAFHCPRGMLEFWIDPASEYYRETFKPDQRYILYCAGGGRSALAAKTMKDMGYPDVAHLETGFGGWEKAGLPVEDVKTTSKWVLKDDA
jgi:rhodanese-related sulfurtransferase